MSQQYILIICLYNLIVSTILLNIPLYNKAPEFILLSILPFFKIGFQEPCSLKSLSVFSSFSVVFQ